MKHLRLKFVLASNMNFTIRVFTWNLENDNNICKKYSAQFGQ